MKIAVAVYGIPRGAAIAVPSLIEKIISPARELDKVEVGLFGHFFLQDRVVNLRSNENGPLDYNNYTFFQSVKMVVEQPVHCLKTWHFNLLQDYGDAWTDNFRSLANLVHALHSLRKVTLMVEKFDPNVVIFARPDLYYYDSLSVKHIYAAMNNALRCYLPAWQWWGGYNDRFAICGQDIYRQYGRRIEVSLQFCEQLAMPLHGETFLRYVLSRARASIRITRMRASRVRINSIIKREDFHAMATLGSASIRLKLDLLACLLLSALGG